jgi:glycine cleavage system H protein
MYPDDRKYCETHEWAKVDEGLVLIGITDYAVKELTDLTYLELPQTGESFETGDPFGVIESVKATSDLYAPVAGEVVEVNESLPDALDLFNEDPYRASWMIKLRPANLDQDVGALLSAEQYSERVGEH